MRYPLLLALIALLNSTLFAQQSKSFDQAEYSIQKLPGKDSVYTHFVKITRNKTQITETEVRVIVRFKSAPTSATNPNARSSAEAIHKTEREQLLADVTKVISGMRSAKAPTFKIGHDYHKVFNGISLTTTKFLSDQIRTLSYVSLVTEDHEIKLNDITSSTIIHAPEVWSKLGVTGKGVTIGIIDTGVDYKHPDLGGGFGPGFKVIGGYDFANNDTDPLDDNGHGSHVAGIAAANGPSLKGVAPDATIISYKALDNWGSGWDSWILAAVERTVDPDQNPETDDAIDVVNMSLGRTAYDYDVLSEAVNNAISQGVVFAVAAGNAYDNMTIGSPGIADQAITVGATDYSDNTANFSSRGPSLPDFNLKPDLTAPGVDIYSAFKDEGYATLSGTSMATPHVAGAVALLLQKHPNWQPVQVKAALMNTARQSWESIWNQGAGRIDVLAAINTETIITPASFSIGRPSGTNYQKTFNVTVFNESNNTVDYYPYITGDLTNTTGVSYNLNSSYFSLAPHAFHTLSLTFTIDAQQLKKINVPDVLTGSLTIMTGDYVTTSAPITITNPTVTTVKFDGTLPSMVSVIGSTGGNFFKAYFPQTNKLDLFIPEGQYDFIHYFDGLRTVVTEDFMITGSNEITVSKELAKNQIIMVPVNSKGNKIPITPNSLGTSIFSGAGKNYSTLYFGIVDTLYLSDLKGYYFEINIHQNDEDSIHFNSVVVRADSPIRESKAYSNSGKFYNFDITNPSASLKQRLRASSTLGAFTITPFNSQLVNNPLKVQTSEKSTESHFNGLLFNLVPVSGESGYHWQTPIINQRNGTFTLQNATGDIIFETENSKYNYNLGQTLLHFTATPLVNNKQIAFGDLYHDGMFLRHFGDRELANINYQLSQQDGTILKSGILKNPSIPEYGNSRITVDATQFQSYKLKLTYGDYQVRGKFGTATAILDFNTSNFDMNPPSIKDLSLNVDGVSVDKLNRNQNATLVIKVSDECYDPANWYNCQSSGINSISVQIKQLDDSNWTTVETYQSDYNEYHGDLPTLSKDGYYAIRVTVNDNSYNSLTYEMSPGFLVGAETNSTPYANVLLVKPFDGNINAGTKPTFSWTAIPSSKYTLQVSTDPEMASTLYETKVESTSHTNPVEFEKDQTLYWRVKATAANSELPWSTVNQFKTSTLDNPNLIVPKKGSTLLEDSITFTWSRATGAYYSIVVSKNKDFTDSVAKYLGDTTVRLKIARNNKYYWKVYAIYNDAFGHIYKIPSEVFTFSNFVPGTIELINGIENSLETSIRVYPNPVTSQTKIAFENKREGSVSLIIYNQLGERIKYITKNCSSGPDSFIWKADNENNELVHDGLYIAVLKTATEHGQVKLLVHRE